MTQEKDLCLPVGDGFVNVRVGAIIEKDGKLLLVCNDKGRWCYTVGGRIRLGETAEEAVRREVLEETGSCLEVERLGFFHENFFLDDSPARRGKLIHEYDFYFYMKTPADFEPRCDGVAAEGRGEHLEWVSTDTERTLYPDFFRTELAKPVPFVRHIVTDERKTPHSEAF
ncbi:MAG: NUDIX domain-containing protein [Oscillospiraceae bacterium]|nr:NUDIX domain-containing protein [Oscillospiraceae bacterium]